MSAGPTIERAAVPFETAGGIAVSAYRYGSVRAGAVIVAHGILAHQRLPEIVTLAERLADEHTVYTLDFRGHGESGARFTFGCEEHQDLGELVRRVRASHRRVALVGFSFGGFHALLTASHDPVDAICTVSAPAHLRVLDHFPLGGAYLETLPHILRRRRGRVRVELGRWPRLNPVDVVGRLEAPLLVVHGTRDWIVSLRHARLIHELARGPKTLEVIDGGLHAEYLLVQDPAGMRRRISSFIRATIG